jgi:hypothetical protein
VPHQSLDAVFKARMGAVHGGVGLGSNGGRGGFLFSLSVLDTNARRLHLPSSHQVVAELLTAGSADCLDTEGKLSGILDHAFGQMPSEAASMLLDVATVLRGMPKEYALAAWRKWHGVGADSMFGQWLKDGGLVDTDSDGDLAMHDVLVALARGKVLDSNSPYYGSRLWLESDAVKGYVKVRSGPSSDAVAAGGRLPLAHLRLLTPLHASSCSSRVLQWRWLG